MLGFNFGNKDNNDQEHLDQNPNKNELERFFEDEDWDIGQKGGEVEKGQDIDWSNYDFMHTFDELSEAEDDQDDDDRDVAS